jgi:hypothetical protein
MEENEKIQQMAHPHLPMTREEIEKWEHIWGFEMTKDESQQFLQNIAIPDYLDPSTDSRQIFIWESNALKWYLTGTIVVVAIDVEEARQKILDAVHQQNAPTLLGKPNSLTDIMGMHGSLEMLQEDLAKPPRIVPLHTAILTIGSD